MMRFLMILILFQLWLAGSVPAEVLPQTFTGKGLSVRLVSDVTTIQAGQTFYLGLWLKHEPGYHTYWQNPGLAGVPTRLVPQLPPGFTIGRLLYPPPDKVKMAAINVHGYSRDVLVALAVTAPIDWAEDSLTIPVEASWMCCLRTCNPGMARLSLTVLRGHRNIVDDRWAPQFQALLAVQPPLLTGWDVSAIRSAKEIELTMHPTVSQALPGMPQFFSLDNLICSHPTQDWQKVGLSYRVRLSLSDFQPDDQSHLRGLLFAEGTWLSGKSAPYVEIAVPVVSAGLTGP